MLEIVTEKNTWYPPELDEEAIYRIFEDYFDEDNGVKENKIPYRRGHFSKGSRQAA